MIFDMSCYPTTVVDYAWQHDGEPFTGERLLEMMDGPYWVNGKPRRVDKAWSKAAPEEARASRRPRLDAKPGGPVWLLGEQQLWKLGG